MMQWFRRYKGCCYLNANSNKADARFISEAEAASKKLRLFMQAESKEQTFISLGENCSSAWYLKQLGLKKASYPFDWIFSSPEIIIDCIKDGFAKFLHQSQIIEKPGKLSAGHAYYHANLFQHKNPLLNHDNYAYYQRCCDRFLEKIKSDIPIVFVLTLINEPLKRPLWADGFTYAFTMPVNQDIASVQPLCSYLKTIHTNSKFIIVDHYTERESSVTCEVIDDTIFAIRFCAGGKSNGLKYENHIDDYCFKLVLSGLCKDTP